MPDRELPTNPRKRLGMEPQPYKNCAICQYALNTSTAPTYTRERKYWQSYAGLFAASRHGRALKGSKHSCGSAVPTDDKNPRRITANIYAREYNKYLFSPSIIAAREPDNPLDNASIVGDCGASPQ